MAEQEKPAPQTEAPPAKEVKGEEKPATEGAAPPVKEVKEKEGGRPQNCSQCKKRLSRKQWYYRNGNTFCSKGCWKAFTEKKAA